MWHGNAARDEWIAQYYFQKACIKPESFISLFVWDIMKALKWFAIVDRTFLTFSVVPSCIYCFPLLVQTLFSDSNFWFFCFSYHICRPLRLDLSPEEEVTASIHLDIIRCDIHFDLCSFPHSIYFLSLSLPLSWDMWTCFLEAYPKFMLMKL